MKCMQCKHGSERTPCPKKEGCTKSSSHPTTRLIKVSQNCSAKPSSLLLGPQGGLPYAVSSKFSPFLRTAKWRDWHLPRAQAPVNPVHKTPSCTGPVKIKWKKNIICMAPPDQFLYVYAQQNATKYAELLYPLQTGTSQQVPGAIGAILVLRFFWSWLRLMGLLRVLLSQFILLNFQLIFRQQHCRQDDVQMVLQRGHSMQLTWP